MKLSVMEIVIFSLMGVSIILYTIIAILDHKKKKKQIAEHKEED